MLAGIELNEIQQRGIERFVQQEARKQANIEAITAQAASQLDESAKTDNLEEDWIAHFFDKCDKVSDAEMQTLWSSLLAGEAQNPGTYSKGLLTLLLPWTRKTQSCLLIFVSLYGWLEVQPR